MINLNSIMSLFDDRFTLLQWLKKLEKALNESTLASISTTQTSEDKLKLIFNFSDGTSIVTPEITLPRGLKGEDGSNGVGFENATKLFLNSANRVLTTDEILGVEINATSYIQANGETFEIPSSMVLSLKGSETIIVDVSEDGNFIIFRLDADIVNKLSRALLIPSAVSETPQIPVIINGGQESATLGDGLSYENGVLTASGGGGGGELYLHAIRGEYTLNMWNSYFSVNIYNNSATPFTKATFDNFINGLELACSGTFYDGTDISNLITITIDETTGLFTVKYIQNNNYLDTSSAISVEGIMSISDNVKKVV